MKALLFASLAAAMACGHAGAATAPAKASAAPRPRPPLVELKAGEAQLEKEGGTFVVPVLINGVLTLKFTLDSGASDISVPSDVVSTLIRTGTIRPDDFIGQQTYILADGSKVKSPTFRLRTLTVGGITLQNVLASVADTKGSLLLGQSFLSRIGSWSVDNSRHVLILNGVNGQPRSEPTPQKPPSLELAATPLAPPPVAAATADGLYQDNASYRIYWPRANQGEAEAQNALGEMYAQGRGVPKDNAAAVSWYRKAADQGYASAQSNLGVIYYVGVGVPKDYAAAVSWFRKAADRGLAVAQYNLGRMYAYGNGVTRDYAAAVSWYREAANQGYGSAQNDLTNLCAIYPTTKGCPYR